MEPHAFGQAYAGTSESGVGPRYFSSAKGNLSDVCQKKTRGSQCLFGPQRRADGSSINHKEILLLYAAFPVK
jgi:hypothetical protein